MNFRNKKYYRVVLARSLKVRSYGNSHIVSSRNTSITVITSYPRIQDFVSIYMMYNQLSEGLCSLDLSYCRFYINRYIPTIEINKKGWRVIITSSHLTIQRMYIKPYGMLTYDTVFDSDVVFDSICSIIKTQLHL